MEFRRIAADYAVSGQIRPEDADAIRQAGFRSVVCHRPDNEDPGQPSVETIRAAAQKAGLEFRHIPVSGGQFPPEAVAAMRAALEELPGPVFAYCRSGARSTNIYALARTQA
ncbi:MAG TPA: TIGR01244 family sulfur transferase [Mesorhizobium sp.]|jgi:uncharacterized protein (TIGR01244 family)|nr:TIGR01244 family sulfur transferase [Mesorhizobium sp.]